MNLALTLSIYIVRHFLFAFFTVLSIFIVLIVMVDAVELLRQSTSLNIPTRIVFEMVMLKLPLLLQTIMPFVILISAVLSYNSLSKKSELVVIRAAGVSVWEFLLPSIITAFLIGVLVVTTINPVSATMYNLHGKLNKKYFEQKDLSTLQISESGLWIKQQQEFSKLEIPDENFEAEFLSKMIDKKYEIIIHATKIIGKENIKIENVSAYAFTPEGTFFFRIDASEADLQKGFWHINRPNIYLNNNKNIEVETLKIPTTVEFGDIQNSFAAPETISFWNLPKFIKKLSNSGFSYFAHLLHWHKTLSSPLFYAAMVMIGAIFCLKSARQAKTGVSVTLSLVIGFIIYFVSNLIFSLGLSGTLPVFVAAWSPIIITLMIGFVLVLHFEDS